MSDDFELDIEALIAPLAGTAPAGTDPREDASAQSLYYRLRDARAEARDAERRVDGGDKDSGAPPQLWRTVRELSVRVLRERAKDLEVAAWLTEALVREEGVAGLTAGATVIGRLAATFWDTGLFPTPDEDGLVTRVAPIAGLSGVSSEGTLAQPLRKQVFFVQPDKSELTFWQYFQAELVEGTGEAARKKVRSDAAQAAGVPPYAVVERDAKAASTADFAALRDELDRAILAWDGMSAVLDDKAGRAAPATGRVRELLNKLLDAVMRFAPTRDEPLPPPDEPEAAPGVAPGALSPPVPVSRAVTRDDMLRDLAKIADYFRKFEPQSPLSLTLDEAIRRARLSWNELLEEVVANADVRNTMLMQLGIRPPKPE